MTRQAISVRARLVLMMAVLFTLGMGALYIAARSYALVAADRSYDRLLAGSALSIAESLSLTDGEILVDVPYAALDMLSAAPDDRVFYRVVGPDRSTVTGYPDLPARIPRAGGRGDANSAPAIFFDAPYRGEGVRFVLLGREVAQPGSTGWVWIQVGQTRRARRELQQELLLRAIAPITFMTVLALAVVWFGIKRALRPLESLGEQIASREPSDLRPIVAPVPAEIAVVIGSLNVFMHRLEANMERMRNFIADAAHQMRTPLAAMLAQAQVSADGDREELRDAVGTIERNASKLTRLINQLLSDATVHHRSDARCFEPFDLLPVISHAMHDSVPLSQDSDVRFTTLVDSAPLLGDPVMIGEAIKNLIHNALRHGFSEEGEVQISLEAEEANYLLTIEDRGPGIRAQDRDTLFERFARGSAAVPGAGLGLAIVREAIESHGGSVDLADRQGGGLRVEMILPRGGA